MFKAAGRDGSRSRTLKIIVIASIGLEALVVGLIFLYERQGREAEQKALSSTLNQDVWWGETDSEPIRLPPTIPASEAKLRPDEKVVGVEIGGKARAYRLEALGDPTGHLVNDLVGGIPISVAYCDLTDCLKVYSEPEGTVPARAQGCWHLQFRDGPEDGRDLVLSEIRVAGRSRGVSELDPLPTAHSPPNDLARMGEASSPHRRLRGRTAQVRAESHPTAIRSRRSRSGIRATGRPLNLFGRSHGDQEGDEKSRHEPHHGGTR